MRPRIPKAHKVEPFHYSDAEARAILDHLARYLDKGSPDDRWCRQVGFLRACEALAERYQISLDSGFNEPPAPRRDTEARLRRLRKGAGALRSAFKDFAKQWNASRAETRARVCRDGDEILAEIGAGIHVFERRIAAAGEALAGEARPGGRTPEHAEGFFAASLAELWVEITGRSLGRANRAGDHSGPFPTLLALAISPASRRFGGSFQSGTHLARELHDAHR